MPNLKDTLIGKWQVPSLKGHNLREMKPFPESPATERNLLGVQGESLNARLSER